MKKFIIGALVLLIAVPGFSFTFSNFLIFLAGLIPVLILLGGAIAVYLGIEELKQSDDSEITVEPEGQPTERIEKNVENQAKEPVLNTPEIKPEPEPEPIEKTKEAITNKPDEQPAPAESLTPEAEEPAVESVQFKGNVETLVFHTVECNFASGKNCSMDFTTKEEAETQGYKPCKVCMPDA